MSHMTKCGLALTDMDLIGRALDNLGYKTRKLAAGETISIGGTSVTAELAIQGKPIAFTRGGDGRISILADWYGNKGQFISKLETEYTTQFVIEEAATHGISITNRNDVEGGVELEVERYGVIT